MTTTPYDIFETDKSLEQDGIWIDYGPFMFKIARSGGSNEKYARLLRNRMKPHRRAIQTETLSEEVAQKILLKTFVDAVILDWKGVRDRVGNELPFNKDNAVRLLTDLPDLFSDLQQQSMKAALFRRDEIEEDLGN